MSAIVPIGLPHPSTIAVTQDDPRERANSVIEEKHPGIMEKHPEIRERTWGLAARTDDSVTLEEYQYWAKIERELEKDEQRNYKSSKGKTTALSLITDRFSKGDTVEKRAERQQQSDLQPSGSNPSSHEEMMRATDAEWRQAARALRTAGWGTIFYLVTTDILGWSSAPAVFAATGYGVGVGLFIIFGLAAGFAGWCLWRVYIGMDSARFPMISYGDPFLRLYGSKTRKAVNFAQSLQQFLSVCVVVLGNSVLLDQISKQTICYVVVILIIALVGVASGLIRGLQKIGWICNLSVWFNVACFIMIMYAAGNNAIDYQAAFAGSSLHPKNVIKPVRTFAGRPPAIFQQAAVGFASQFQAISTMVYAYAGAILFVAFMAEMRHPMDFWKGMLCAQCFICFVYLLFGAYTYSQWGQYAIFNITTIVQPYALQTAVNVLSLLTGWFAVFLYFNVGLKTVYQEVFMEVFHFPAIYTKKGKYWWYALGPIYWMLAFIVAAAVPNLQGLVGFIGALFALNFTYSFPALLYLGYNVQRGAQLEGEGFDPYTGQTTRHDGGVKRIMRGFMKRWYTNVPILLFFLLALACSGMGTWSAILSLEVAFGPHGTKATNFGCGHPT